jgi:hypothetical protein
MPSAGSDHRNRAAADLRLRRHDHQDFRIRSLLATGWAKTDSILDWHRNTFQNINLPSTQLILLCYVSRCVATRFATGGHYQAVKMYQNYNKNIINYKLKNVAYKLTPILLMWRIGWAPNSIPIYIQQDSTLHSLFISGNWRTPPTAHSNRFQLFHDSGR